VTASEFPQAIWQGESEQEEGYGQQQILLFMQPLLSSIVMTLRAVTIAARVITVLGLIAIQTVINMATQGFRPALLDRPHGLMMAG
jgi:hypothetical protein